MPHPLPYRGRFAPSPTGALHFGSLVAAMGSYLEARAGGGEWLVRMEDLDPPREVPGAADLILRTLERYGLTWDGPVLYQSTRQEIYRDALDRLLRRGAAFACDCSRKAIAAAAAARGLPAHVYPGTCRAGAQSPQGRAIRVTTAGVALGFTDLLQGPQQQDLEREVGDFVVRRADGLFAYQLAVVVDDAAQGVTHVVRGSDLLDSTARQIWLQRLLDLPTPAYLHLPVAVNTLEQKLSKQTHAPALDLENPLPTLWQALAFLGQEPPAALLEGDVPAFWRWAVAHWRRAAVPARPALPCPHRES